jgi:hypothetical protein
MSPATAHAATTVACAAGRLTPPARHEPPDGAPARVITTARDGGQRATIGLQTLDWSGKSVSPTAIGGSDGTGCSVADNRQAMGRLREAARPRRDTDRRQEAALIIAMHSKRVDIDLGVIESEDSLVTDYIEKPSLRYQVSMGIYVYEERALKYLPEDGPCQFPDLVLRLIKAGERVAAYECDADWFDIGTVHEHERAVVDIEQFPEKYDVEAPLLDPHDVSRTLE